MVGAVTACAVVGTASTPTASSRVVKTPIIRFILCPFEYKMMEGLPGDDLNDRDRRKDKRHSKRNPARGAYLWGFRFLMILVTCFQDGHTGLDPI